MSDETLIPSDPTGRPARIDLSAHSPRLLYTEGWDDEIRFADYWRVVVARRWTILGVLLTVVSGTALWTFKQIPVYSAVSRIQIEREDPSILSFDDVYSVEAATDDGLRTQFAIIESRTLAREVVEELGFENVEQALLGNPGLLEDWADRLRTFFLPEGSAVGDPMNKVVSEYLERLTVSPVLQARLVDVSFEHENPELAARIINMHADRFIDQNLRFRFEATQLATEFLSENLTDVKINLERAEDELQEFGRNHQILFSEDGSSTALEKLQQLEAEYIVAQADRISREAYMQFFENGDAAAMAHVAENDLITNLSRQLSDLRAEASEMSAILGPNMQERQALESRTRETERLLAEAKTSVLATVKAEYRAAVSREELLAAAVEMQLGLVNDVNQEIVQYTILRGEIDANRQIYQEMLTRLGEANVSGTLRASNIRIIDRAPVSDKPVKPRKALNLALSVFFGLGLGVGLAFFQEHLNDSINSTDEIAQFLGVPTLGIVPRSSAKVNRGAYAYHGGYGKLESATKPDLPRLGEAANNLEFISHNEPGSPLSEAYRSVRTSLLLSFPDNPPKSILVTSSSPADGKTATAINIGISLAKTGARTLLVSTDLRKIRMDEVFGVGEEQGLSGHLSGAITLEEAVCPSGVPNLSILPCGAMPPNPLELLMSHRFHEMVSQLREDFDHIVFDSPPVENVSDARVLGHVVDCVIFVVRATRTSRYMARHALEQLSASGSRTAGVILNDFDTTKRSNYHSASYYPYSA